MVKEMAGRHHLPPPNTVKTPSQSLPNPSPAVVDARLLHRLPVAPPSTAGTAALEDRVAIQHREIQTLLLENQHLAATHVALKQQLAAAQQDLHALAAAAAAAKAEADARVRELFERSLKAEADVRAIESAAADLERVRGDGRTLATARDELAAELKEVEGELEKAREESKPVRDVKSEIDSVRREIKKGRAAIEKEKKARAHNLEFHKAIEEKMMSMASETEKLRVELANAERRAQVAAAAANPNPVYGGGQPYLEPYNLHQVQSVGEPQYRSGSLSHSSGEMQPPNMYR